MPEKARLISAAVTLRSHAPEAWEGFVMALREFAAASTAEMLRATPDVLLKAQGIALAANDIATTCREAPTLAEKAQRPQHGRPA